MSAAAAGEKVGCVGVVGSSGAVGMEMIKVLNKRNFPTERIRLFARRAAGTTVETGSVFGAVEPFSVEAARECEIILLAVSGGFATQYAKDISG
eukprot:gene32282-730_t